MSMLSQSSSSQAAAALSPVAAAIDANAAGLALPQPGSLNSGVPQPGTGLLPTLGPSSANPSLTRTSVAELRAATASASSPVQQLSTELHSIRTAVAQQTHVLQQEMRATLATKEQKNKRKSLIGEHLREPMKRKIFSSFTKLDLAAFASLVDEQLPEARLRELIGMNSQKFVKSQKKKLRETQRGIYGESNRRLKTIVTQWANDAFGLNIARYQDITPGSPNMMAILQALNTQTMLKALARRLYLDDDRDAVVTERQWRHIAYALDCWANGRDIDQPHGRMHLPMPLPDPNPNDPTENLSAVAADFLQNS